jgi:hypothetical protein
VTVYTYTGNKRLEDWRVTRIVIGTNPDGSHNYLDLGKSADLDDQLYKYLSDRFKLVPGVNAVPDPVPIDPTKGDPGDLRAIHTLDSVGHSYMVGGGAAKDDFGFVREFAKMLRVTNLRQFGVQGAVTCWNTANGTGDGGYPLTLQEDKRVNSNANGYMPGAQLVLLMTGLNDLAALGSQNLRPFQEALRSIIARKCAAAVFEDTDASVVYGGTTSNLASTTVNSGSSVRQMNVGSTATISVPSTFPGGSVSVHFFASFLAAAGCKVNFTVDGVAAGSLDTGSIVCDVANSKSNNVVKRFTNLAPGAHTIVCTVAGDTTYFDCWEIEANPLDGPLLMWVAQPRCPSYSLWNSWTHGPSAGTDPMNDASVVALRAATDAVMADFPQRAIKIDVDSIFNKAIGYFGTDQGHPNNVGHSVIAEECLKALGSSPLVTSRALTRPSVDPAPYFFPVGKYGGLIPFNNSWVNFGGSARPLGVRKKNDGEVHITGVVKSGGAALSVATISLFGEWRPLFNSDFSVVTWNGSVFSTAQVRIQTDGAIVPLQNVSNVYLALDIRYVGEQ